MVNWLDVYNSVVNGEDYAVKVEMWNLDLLFLKSGIKPSSPLGHHFIGLLSLFFSLLNFWYTDQTKVTIDLNKVMRKLLFWCILKTIIGDSNE